MSVSARSPSVRSNARRTRDDLGRVYTSRRPYSPDSSDDYDSDQLDFGVQGRSWTRFSERIDTRVRTGNIVIHFPQQDVGARIRGRVNDRIEIEGQVSTNGNRVERLRLDGDDFNYIVAKIDGKPPHNWRRPGTTFWIQADLVKYAPSLRVFEGSTQLHVVYKVHSWKPETITSRAPHLTLEQNDRLLERTKVEACRARSSAEGVDRVIDRRREEQDRQASGPLGPAWFES